jgi:hypothetical protein
MTRLGVHHKIARGRPFEEQLGGVEETIAAANRAIATERLRPAEPKSAAIGGRENRGTSTDQLHRTAREHMNVLSLLAQANTTSSGAGGAIFAGGFFMIFVILALVTSIFWIWMLIDCLTSSLPSTEKLIWVLVIVFLHILGALLYFFLARRNSSRSSV